MNFCLGSYRPVISTVLMADAIPNGQAWDQKIKKNSQIIPEALSKPLGLWNQRQLSTDDTIMHKESWKLPEIKF